MRRQKLVVFLLIFKQRFGSDNAVRYLAVFYLGYYFVDILLPIDFGRQRRTYGHKVRSRFRENRRILVKL